MEPNKLQQGNNTVPQQEGPAFPSATVMASVLDQLPLPLFITDTDSNIVYANGAFTESTAYSSAEIVGQPARILNSGEHDTSFFESMWTTLESGQPWQGRLVNRRKDGSLYRRDTLMWPLKGNDGAISHYVVLARTDRDETEHKTQLLQAQKMEAIGELAAGIAHEINTPTQYIGDNIRFFQESFRDLHALLDQYDALLESAKSGTVSTDLIQEIADLKKRIDLEYLIEEIPSAIEQSLEGNKRVTEIVRAMKEFAHPGSEEMTLMDLNRAINNTVAFARNEWKYVADVSTDLDPSLPEIWCIPGAFNQVILNLLVNAAHAISEAIGTTPETKGHIDIQTRRDGEWAEIRVRDSGTGIPEAIRTRIFDPFFTTKGVGRGTGQGLASAHFIIAEKHEGTIRFETETGMGTTFIVRVPLSRDVAP